MHLVATLKLDWNEVSQVLGQLGNTPGIYPDVAMLLERMAARDDVKTMIEFGSGVSTLYLAKAALKYGKHFYSVEEAPRWSSMTQSLLKHFHVDSNLVLYDEHLFVPSCDLLFLDCSPPLRRTVLHKQKSLCESRFILLDDSEKPEFFVPVVSTLSSLGRLYFYSYNPTSRGDRVVMINPRDNSYDVNEWVWTWRPRP